MMIGSWMVSSVDSLGLTQESASAITFSFPGIHSMMNVYGHDLIAILWILGDTCNMCFFKMETKGL